MLELKARKHGYVVVMTETITLEDIRRLQFQLKDERAGAEDDFVLVLDIRKFVCFTADAQALLQEILEEFPDSGLAKVSVIAVSTAFASQFCNIMVSADIMALYQFLDIAYEEDWRMEMETWLSEPFA
jgi:hypothetical protein